MYNHTMEILQPLVILQKERDPFFLFFLSDSLLFIIAASKCTIVGLTSY